MATFIKLHKQIVLQIVGTSGNGPNYFSIFSINLYRDNSVIMIRRKIDDFYIDSYGHPNYGSFCGLEESNITNGLDKQRFKLHWNNFVDVQLRANENTLFMKFEV